MTLEEAYLKASPMLRMKMEHSVALLKKAERLSLLYDPDDGFFLAFSGGKDSQALYHIALLAGVRFVPHFSPTTVDPPQLIRFIRNNYPDVVFGKVEKNIYDMAVEKQILPTMRVRWCCAEYKEMSGAGKVTLIGIRHSESVRRSKRNEVEISNRKFSGDFEQFTEWQEGVIRKKYKNLNQDQFSHDKEQTVRCIGGKDSILISPIIEWTERDVWEFLNNVVAVSHCELYDKGYHRIGCIMCPMSGYRQKIRECEDFPYVKAKWIDAIKRIRRGGIQRRIYLVEHPKGQHHRPEQWGGQQRKLLGNGRGREERVVTERERISQEQGRNGFLREQEGFWTRGGAEPGGSQAVCEKTEVFGKTVDCQAPTPIPDEELENRIAENIFDWWISGKSYEEWYADKFLQGEIEFKEK